MGLEKEADFEAVIRQHKTGQKIVNIPKAVSHKYPSGKKYLFWVKEEGDEQ